MVVNLYNSPVTGHAVSDIVNVSLTKSSGLYRGFTTSGSALPDSNGNAAVTFHLGTGAGDYFVTLVGSQFGHVQCATFTIR